MTPEKAWKMHEQWLRSIDSNLGRIAADGAEFRKSLAAQNQSSSAAAWKTLNLQAAAHREAFAVNIRESAEEHWRRQGLCGSLERLVEQSIRFRGNGQSQ